MKTKTEYLWFNTENHREYINITRKIQEIVTNSGQFDMLVYIPAFKNDFKVSP